MRISADYIRGLNLVLDRRTDEALELFVQIAKVDDETLETHFALGHLFRRRGEVDFVEAGAGQEARGDFLIGARQRRRSTSWAQLWPGAPVTPPPGWVPAPHM